MAFLCLVIDTFFGSQYRDFGGVTILFGYIVGYLGGLVFLVLAVVSAKKKIKHMAIPLVFTLAQSLLVLFGIVIAMVAHGHFNGTSLFRGTCSVILMAAMLLVFLLAATKSTNGKYVFIALCAASIVILSISHLRMSWLRGIAPILGRSGYTMPFLRGIFSNLSGSFIDIAPYIAYLLLALGLRPDAGDAQKGHMPIGQ